MGPVRGTELGRDGRKREGNCYRLHMKCGLRHPRAKALNIGTMGRRTELLRYLQSYKRRNLMSESPPLRLEDPGVGIRAWLASRHFESDDDSSELGMPPEISS